MNRKLVLFGMLLVTGSSFAQPPVITIQPQDQTNLVGTTATFAVQAEGAAPLAYQWQRNGWDLGACTNCLLVLTNLRSTDTAAYSAVVTNAEGAVTSRVARLTVALPPSGYVKSTAPYQRMAVFRGSNTSFTIISAGTPPLSFQWRFEGQTLLGQTNKTLAVTAAEPEHEGDYSVSISNWWGSITSAPARLFVTPPAAQFVKSNYIDEAQQRLPYFLLQPEDYTPTRSYPLVCVLHGTPGNEGMFQGYADIGPQAIGAVYASYRRQQTDPAIVVWPARRGTDTQWTAQYIQQVLGLLSQLTTQLNVDTNRIYICGMSEGVHAVWDCLGSRPAFFAGAVVLAGWQGDSRASSIKEVPHWVFCARDDDLIFGTRTLVNELQRAGGNVIYTEYNGGGHMDGIAMGLCTPVAVDWLLGQRRGQPSTNEPLVEITKPSPAARWQTGRASIDLSGWSSAVGEAIAQVCWTNFANSTRGGASGTNPWSFATIPLQPNRTNMVIVTATTTSWASAGFGGATTFNDSLQVICAPIQLTIAPQERSLVLTWTGGGPPFSLQSTAELPPSQWTEIEPDAKPPVTVPLESGTMFYRVVGR